MHWETESFLSIWRPVMTYGLGKAQLSIEKVMLKEKLPNSKLTHMEHHGNDGDNRNDNCAKMGMG